VGGGNRMVTNERWWICEKGGTRQYVSSVGKSLVGVRSK